MASVTIQRRGKVYQYKFEIASSDGKRKFVNKSGFGTKAEAQEAGNLAYTEYQKAGIPFKLTIEKILEKNRASDIFIYDWALDTHVA